MTLYDIAKTHVLTTAATAALETLINEIHEAKAVELQALHHNYQSQLEAKETAYAELQQTHTDYVATAAATIKRADAVIQDQTVDDPATLAELKTIVATLQLQELDAKLAELQAQREEMAR